MRRPRLIPARGVSSFLRRASPRVADSIRSTATLRAVSGGTLLALFVVFVLQRLHGSAHEANEPGPVLHWLRDGLLAAPVGVLAVLAATPLARVLWPFASGRPAGRLVWALCGALVFAFASTPGNELHGRLFGAQHGDVSVLRHLLGDGTATALIAFVVLLVPLLVPGPSWRPRPRRLRPALASVLVPVAALAVALPLAIASTTGATAASCTPESAARAYDVVAISVPIPFNRWGDVLENGQVFVLRGDRAAVDNWYRPLAADPASDPAGNRRLRPRPLVLRANAGECVSVTFTNELDANLLGRDGLPPNPRASIHVHGPAYDPQTSDGSAVGFNADTTVPNADDPATSAVENQIRYAWVAPSREGLYLFHDHGVPAGSEHDAGASGFGLFGGLAVEPSGSTWSDPVSGAPLYTGTSTQSGDLYIDADIQPPTGRAFRESIQISWDEMPQPGAFSFNYGSEVGSQRRAHRCPDCVSEETQLSSWAYGDPALIKLASGLGPWLPPTDGSDPEDCGLPVSCYVSNVTHTYVGDPAKIRFGHAGTKETHVFHLHAHQWLAEPDDVGAAGPTPSAPSLTARAESTTVDSQTFGPGETFTADLLFGAGSKPGTFGDSIFHCHLYPHFDEGFWSLLRVHDVREYGRGSMPAGVPGRTPDRVGVRALQPLPGTAAVPDATPTNPGFPRFIPGKSGWRPPQPPGGVSTGPGGPLAPRIVAGQELTPADTAVERAVQERFYGSAQPKPGAPFRDPCPAGAREVTYNVSVLQRDIVYNEAGWHDTQGRLLVLDRDVAAVRAGTKQPEPLFIRVNAGDCINFNLTNLLPNFIGNDAFMQLAQTNMVGEHIHLVKFDVLASDGSTNGWNYNQAAFTEDQASFNASVLAGTRSCTADEAQGACRLPLPATWDPSYSGVDPGQTIHERWFADYELRTVFTHDHHFPVIDQNRGLFGTLIVEPHGMDVRDPVSGRFFQPINDPRNGTPCGAACEGDAAGAIADVIGPGPADDFREFGLALQDFVSLTRAGGDPRNPADTFNPPAAPEVSPNEDPGVMGINYRNAPFVLRQQKLGRAIDPAYTFSSWVFGDPATPLLRAYGGDRVRIRLIQGSQEEQHVFFLNGMRARLEPDDPLSKLVASRPLGVSDALNFELPRVECGPMGLTCVGDYLYGGAATDDLYLGMWGILRVFPTGLGGGLLGLPDNPAPAPVKLPDLKPTGYPPLRASNPVTRCPAGSPLRRYSVVAMQTPIRYNAAGDNDPYGLIFALAGDEAAIRARTRKPEPLVLRANEGDCVEVTLRNTLTPAFLGHAGAADGDPRLPLEPPAGTGAGLRVSLSPQLVDYSAFGSAGATVGFGLDQTVGPGEWTVYRWSIPETSPGELGVVNLLDYGDVRGHRHHGLFAALVVEPRGSTYHDPLTGAEVQGGVSADIRVPGGQDFREFVPFVQDGLNLRDASGTALPDQGSGGAGLDAEDQGEKGFGYGSEPFWRRLGFAPQDPLPVVPAGAWAGAFSSRLHGDPSTPIFRAYEGDPIRIRLVQGADKPRQNAFSLNGAAWLADPGDPNSPLIATQGGFSVGSAANIHLPAGLPGDYRYGSEVAFHHLSGGQWGILRVYPRPAGGVTPEKLRDTDDPTQPGYYPLVPLETETTPAPPPVVVPDPPPVVVPAPQPVAAPPAAPTSWVSLSGTVLGSVSALAANDGRYLLLRSRGLFVGVVDGYGAYVLPPSQRRVVGLTVSYDGGATVVVHPRTFSLYNFTSGTWETVGSDVQTVADKTFTATVSGNPARFVSPSGELRLRVRGTRPGTFSFKADAMSFAVTYQP